MAQIEARDIEYLDGTERMLGYFCTPLGDGENARPGVLVVHGAHGLDEQIVSCSRRIAALGYAVLAADLWGDRAILSEPSRIDAMIGTFAGDRSLWMGRLAAGHQALSDQPGTDPDRIGAVGYCFGGSSLLEYTRTGGTTHGIVSFHGGLDLVADDWTAAEAGSNVLICTGAEDPMAKPEDLARLQTAMTQADINWESDIYSQAKHAFTEPDDASKPPFTAYDARAERRSWDAMRLFFEDVFGN